MQYTDAFNPRPCQAEIAEAVEDGFATGRKVTVCLCAPGSGKTLSYQSTATYLLRTGRIKYVAVFAPRVNLARQCELDWMRRDKDTSELHGHFKLFDAKLRFGKISHRDAVVPLIEPGAIGTGFASTYAALTGVSSSVFTDWAKDHEGEFLLVADEAQFCGADDDNGRSVGTRAGALIKELSEYAAHTLLLTGTPYRADGKPLVLSEYTDPDERGKQHLIHHVEATYADGVDEGYLRRFEFLVSDGDVTETDVAGEWSTTYKLSSRANNLAPILRMPTTWQPLADRVVQGVREKQVLNPAYRGLISCMQKKDAQQIAEYLRARYPGLRVYVAVSGDGEAGRKTLQEFKDEPRADVLVTVRMAFIGYDCKTITVVGVLTHYRDQGHLMQLVGRGLRVWDKEPTDEQVCRIIAPDDKRMQAFIEYLRKQQDEGMRRRKERLGDCGPDLDPEQLTYIEATQLTTTRAASNDTDVDHDERLLYEAAKRELGLVDEVTKLARLSDFLGERLKGAVWSQPATEPEPPTVPVATRALTDKQQVEQLKSETVDEITGYLADRSILPGRSDYGKFMGKVTARVNEYAGFKAGDIRTVEQAQARLQAAKAIRGNA